MNVQIGSFWWVVNFGVMGTLLFAAIAAFLRARLREEMARKTERELQRANRLYATLARANDAALNAQSREELSELICAALIENAGMRLAWIGWENAAERRLEIVAVAGEARGYVDGLSISTDPEDERSRGPTGRAVLTGEPQVCQDVETDPNLAPWRERQEKWGIRSSAAVRLLDAGGNRGTLTLYSEEPGFFSDQIMRLVQQMVADFTHALEVLAARRLLAEQTTALRESERRYRALFEQNHAAILLVEPSDGKILDVNEAACRFYGYDRKDFTKLSVVQLNTSPAETLRTEIAELVRSGKSRVFHFRHRLADGSARDVEVVSGPMVIAGRELLFSIVHDETDRVRAEHDLVASEKRLKLALAAAQQGAWDLDVATGEAKVSPEYARMLGYAPEEFSENNAAWSSRLHPDDKEESERALRELTAGLRTSYNIEFRQRTKTGEWKWIQSHAQIVERDAAGQPTRIIGVHTDITERRAALERLRVQGAALESAANVIVITDATGRIEWVNDAFTRTTGYTREEAIGGNPRILKSGRHPHEFYEQMWATMLAGNVWRGELHNRRKDGSPLDEEAVITPVRAAGGAITHFVAIKQDVTERKKLEQQLLRAQRMDGIGMLAGGIAHDLNNVLAPILLSMEMLRMRYPESAALRTLELVESSARRGASIVKQVLTFARGIDGERVRIRPRDLVREIVSMIEETFPREITVRRVMSAETPPISGDMTQLHQVLLNLAVNARDAMPGGGTMTFKVETAVLSQDTDVFSGALKAGNYVILAVEDTGQGMTPEVKNRLFEPFFTTKDRGKGTGLGLPTVLGIVRSHGGAIDVRSELGAGSEFRVYLPALPPEEGEASIESADVSLIGAGRTVLIADDESAIREVAAAVLRQTGFEVIEAANGRDAVTLFTQHEDRVAAIVMDIMMPLMTGDRAAAEILARRPGLPILFMSGLMEQSAVGAALKNVPTQVVLIRKPFIASELLQQLARVLERRANETL